MREKVKAAAAALGLDVEIKTLTGRPAPWRRPRPPWRSSPARSRSRLVFMADGEPMVIVASGAHRVEWTSSRSRATAP